MFVKCYEYEVDPRNFDAFSHIQSDVCKIYREYTNCDFVFLRDLEESSKWLEVNWFPSYEEYKKAIENINRDERIKQLWEEGETLFYNFAREQSCQVIRNDGNFSINDSFVKVYRYSIQPDKMKQYLYVQDEASKIYEKYIKDFAQHLQDHEYMENIIQVQWLPSQDIYNNSMEKVNDTKRISELWQQFLDTLAKNNKTVEERFFEPKYFHENFLLLKSNSV